MKAVVLAAGTGRRLWPLTENRPKPMIPVRNRPILEHIIEALGAAGVTEVILIIGANRNRVRSYFQNGQEYAVDITYVIQDEQLGTAHALLQAEALFGDSFLVLNGDRIVESSIIDDVWETHQISDNPVLAITQAATPSRYGAVDMNEEFAKGITEQPRPESVTSEFINAGVYAFMPGVFSAIRALDVHSEQAVTDVPTLFIDGKRLRVVRYNGLSADVSEPWDLLVINDSLLAYHGPSDRDDQTAQIDISVIISDDAVLGDDVVIHPQTAISYGVTLGANVQIGPKVIVENAVILFDVTIKSIFVVTDGIVGANTTLGANTTIEGGNADVVLDDTVYHEMSFGGLIGDNVSIGGNVTITPGTIVGNDTTIKSGASASGRIPADSHVQRG